MAYVPPHKRVSNSQLDLPPSPEVLAPQMKNKMSLHSDRRSDKQVKRIIYADHSISRCLVVPLQDDDKIPSSVHLVPVSSESVKWRGGEKPLTLVNDLSQQECNDMKNLPFKKPWTSVTEMVHSDLLSAFQNVTDEMGNESLVEVKPAIVARFGKVLFHGIPSLSLDSLKEYSVSEASLRKLRKTFHTDVPISFVEHVKKVAVPKMGLNFEGKKEQYHVKLSDAKKPGSMISCKCRIKEGEEKIELYKIELSPIRQLVEVISCIDSSVDLRFALCTKRNKAVVADEEKENIRDIVNSAKLDPNVKGGLRWPLGVANSRGRYSVIGAWHMNCEFYSNSSMRLKVREADRYDFLTSAGDVTRETVLRLTGMARNLMEKGDEGGVDVSTPLEDTLKLIWEHFLSWDGSLVSYCET